MISCGRCGAPAVEGDRFCGRCGSPLGASSSPSGGGRFCTRCGAGLGPGVRFCGSCGADSAASDIWADDLEEPAVTLPSAAPPSNGLTVVDDDEDLLAEWEDALRFPEAPTRRRRIEDPAITETIVRPAPAPVTESIALPPSPEPVRNTSVIPVVAPVPMSPSSAAPRTPFRFPLAATLALLGALAVILSAVLPWEGPFRSPLPRDILAARLLSERAPSEGLTLGIILLAVGTLGALMALLTMAVPVLKPLRRLAGLLSISLPFLFALRTAQPLLPTGDISALWPSLGVGVYVAAGGAFVQIVAGRWFSR